MKFTLTDAERDTLERVLDFACCKIRSRVNRGSVMDEWDMFALRMADDKIRQLRDKLFPGAAA